MIRLARNLVMPTAAVLVLLANQAATADTHVSMPTGIRYGHALTPGSALEGGVILAPELRTGSGNVRWRISGRLEGDTEDLLEPGRPAFDGYASLSRPLQLGNWGRIELRDAFVEIPFGRHQARIGKQQIVWGRLDGIKVLDVLNPQRFREFILEDFADSRIGTWSAHLDFLLGGWRAELALIPDTTAHEIPEAGAWFELTAPRFRYGAAPGGPRPLQTTKRPERSDGTVAGRISRKIGGLDLGLIALSGIDFEPLGRLSCETGTPILEQFYERLELYGLQAETAAAGLVFRLEASYQPGRTFNTRTNNGLATRELPQWRAAAGVDIDGPLGIFVNVQYLHDQVMDAPDDLIRPEIDRLVTVFARRTFLHETLDLELRWYGELEKDDGMARGALEYQLGGNTRLRLAGDWFYGDREGLFGQFEARDRVTLALEHTF